MDSCHTGLLEDWTKPHAVNSCKTWIKDKAHLRLASFGSHSAWPLIVHRFGGPPNFAQSDYQLKQPFQIACCNGTCPWQSSTYWTCYVAHLVNAAQLACHWWHVISISVHGSMPGKGFGKAECVCLGVCGISQLSCQHLRLLQGQTMSITKQDGSSTDCIWSWLGVQREVFWDLACYCSAT